MDSSARARVEWQLSKPLRARAFRMTDVEGGDLLLLIGPTKPDFGLGGNVR
jgi:hypothetical protein